MQKEKHPNMYGDYKICCSCKESSDIIENNKHLIEAYDEKFKTRPYLPPKEEFLDYLKNNLNKKKLLEDNIIKKTTIDHWLRSDHCFAYPTVEYWNMIKPYLKEIKYDYQMTFEVESDWE